MEGIEIPTYFLCPISLEIMKDPVTVSTGITYDRESIEKWIFSGKNMPCPVTKQPLSADADHIIPNITVRRMIQSWCTLHASHGIKPISTPKPPINKTQITKLLKDPSKSPELQLKSLQKIKTLASLSDTNKRCIESAGAVESLSLIINNTNTTSSLEDEALSLLCLLQLSESGLNQLVNDNFIESLTRIMQIGSYQPSLYAILLSKHMFEVADPMKIINLKPEFFFAVVKVLRDEISLEASKAALQVLIQICPWGRSRIKAAEAGAVSVAIDLLLDSKEKRVCELLLMVLDQMCGCAEGRAELLKHAAGLAVVSKKILRVSNLASERAVRVILSISKFSATSRVLQEMLEVGVVAKLVLVSQRDCQNKTREKAKEILKLHSRIWKNSSCIPRNLDSLYPS